MAESKLEAIKSDRLNVQLYLPLRQRFIPCLFPLLSKQSASRLTHLPALGDHRKQLRQHLRREQRAGDQAVSQQHCG
jgi:hypothetical protein